MIDPIDLSRSLHPLVASNGVLVPNDCSITQQVAPERGHSDHNFWVAIPNHQSYFDRASPVDPSRATGWSCAPGLAFWPALATLGLGRDLTAFLRPHADAMEQTL